MGNLRDAPRPGLMRSHGPEASSDPTVRRRPKGADEGAIEGARHASVRPPVSSAWMLPSTEAGRPLPWSPCPAMAPAWRAKAEGQVKLASRAVMQPKTDRQNSYGQ